MEMSCFDACSYFKTFLIQCKLHSEMHGRNTSDSRGAGFLPGGSLGAERSNGVTDMKLLSPFPILANYTQQGQEGALRPPFANFMHARTSSCWIQVDSVVSCPPFM